MATKFIESTGQYVQIETVAEPTQITIEKSDEVGYVDVVVMSDVTYMTKCLRIPADAVAKFEKAFADYQAAAPQSPPPPADDEAGAEVAASPADMA